MSRGNSSVETAGERGSTLPFVLVSWLIAALLTDGAIAAPDAFLKQPEVRSLLRRRARRGRPCRGVAAYREGVGPQLPLTGARAEQAVAEQLLPQACAWTRGRLPPAAPR